MDWTHPLKANDLYHMSSPALEPTRNEEARLPKNTWRRNLEAKTKRMGHTWGQLERLTQDQDARRALVGGLCSSRK